MKGSVIVALLVMGSASFFGGCTGRVKGGVSAEGVMVGGLPFAQAEALVRAEIARNLPPVTVHAPRGEYTVAYPELSFTDNIPSLLRGAKRGETLTVSYERTWADAEETLLEICAENVKQAKDATLSFTNDGFTYISEEKGVAAEYEALKRDVFQALKTGGTEVTLRTREYLPAVTEEKLREGTRLLSSFETHFSKNNPSRVQNIRVSAFKIGGTRLNPQEEFSFNATVGARTKENGYGEATVILNGEFQKGIGGGVCQTSTTLFNAALHAGMQITQSRPHSLSVSYVPPSLDAMVSSESDLKFKNPYDFPVYITAEMEEESVRFLFYGENDGSRFETESVVLMRVAPPAPKLVEGEENLVLREAKEGIASESYLLKYSREGKLVYRKLIRRDSYAAVQGIEQIAE